MNFEDGLYKVAFATHLGGGTGVAYLHGGKLRGGDTLMAYVGSYNEHQGKVNADVLVYQHSIVPNMAPALGVSKANLTLNGTVTGGVGTLTGTAPEAPGVTLKLTMERLHD